MLSNAEIRARLDAIVDAMYEGSLRVREMGDQHLISEPVFDGIEALKADLPDPAPIIRTQLTTGYGRIHAAKAQETRPTQTYDANSGEIVTVDMRGDVTYCGRFIPLVWNTARQDQPIACTTCLKKMAAAGIAVRP